MTRLDDPALVAAQLYDEWGGWYMLQKLVNGQYIDIRQLSRAESMTYITARDEVLDARGIE